MTTQYKITITSYGENPNYEAQLADLNEKNQTRMNRMYGEIKDSDTQVLRMHIERVLEVFLTEAEYKKIKAEVIKAFE